MRVVVTVMEVVGIAIFLVMLGYVLYFGIKQYLRESRCKHDKGVRETHACHAICIECGKDLGFIGTWRDKNIKEKGNAENGRDSK